jgi:hypothetical protein
MTEYAPGDGHNIVYLPDGSTLVIFGSVAVDDVVTLHVEDLAGGGTKALAGTIASATTVSSSAGYRSRTVTGSFAAVSAFSSGSILRSKSIVGSLAGASAFTAAPLNRLKEFIGSFAAVSSFTAAPLNRLKEFVGSFAAVTTFTGVLAGSGSKALAGIISVLSSVGPGFMLDENDDPVTDSFGNPIYESDLTLKRSRSYWGSIAATSAFTTAPLNRLKRFAGDFAAVSAFTGALTLAGLATKALAGTIAAVSSLIGGVQRARIVQGGLDSTSSFTAAPLNRLKEFVGSFAATSALTGALTVTGAAVKVLTGAIDAVSSFTSRPLERSRIVQGSIAASATLTAAALKRLKRAVGSLAAVSTFIGNLTSAEETGCLCAAEIAALDAKIDTLTRKLNFIISQVT